MSDELKRLMPDDKYVSKGYIMYDKLVKYIEDREKQLLSDLTQSCDFQLVCLVVKGNQIFLRLVVISNHHIQVPRILVQELQRHRLLRIFLL